jgi:hypothetical protein
MRCFRVSCKTMDKLLLGGSIFVCSFIACGGGSNNAKQPDAHVGSGGSAVCTASSSYGAASVTMGSAYAFTAAEITADGSAGFVDSNQGFNGDLNADPEPDLFEIDLYEGFGAFAAGSGTITSGSVTLAGDDLFFQKCGLCVQLYTNIGSDGSPTDQYFATGGTVDLTSVGSPTGSNVSTGTLSGTLSNVSFAHWNSTGSNDQAYGDCTSTITSLTFSATLEPVVESFQGGPTRIIGRRMR